MITYAFVSVLYRSVPEPAMSLTTMDALTGLGLKECLTMTTATRGTVLTIIYNVLKKEHGLYVKKLKSFDVDDEEPPPVAKPSS